MSAPRMLCRSMLILHIDQAEASFTWPQSRRFVASPPDCSMYSRLMMSMPPEPRRHAGTTSESIAVHQVHDAIPAPLLAALVDRGTSGILHREGRTGQQIAYIYFEDEPQRQMSMKRLSRDEARRIAANVAKLPDFIGTSRK